LQFLIIVGDCGPWNLSFIANPFLEYKMLNNRHCLCFAIVAFTIAASMSTSYYSHHYYYYLPTTLVFTFSSHVIAIMVFLPPLLSHYQFPYIAIFVVTIIIIGLIWHQTISYSSFMSMLSSWLLVLRHILVGSSVRVLILVTLLSDLRFESSWVQIIIWCWTHPRFIR